MRVQILKFCAGFALCAAGVFVADDAQAQRYDYFEMECGSLFARTNECDVGARVVEARIRHQVSPVPCLYGRNWGYTSYSVWTAGGCHAIFDVTTEARYPAPRPLPPPPPRHPPRPWPPGPGPIPPSHSYTLRCESEGNRTERCRVGGGIDQVVLERRISSAGCREGRDWWYDYNTITVANGCRAVFRVFSR